MSISTCIGSVLKEGAWDWPFYELKKPGRGERNHGYAKRGMK